MKKSCLSIHLLPRRLLYLSYLAHHGFRLFVGLELALSHCSLVLLCVPLTLLLGSSSVSTRHGKGWGLEWPSCVLASEPALGLKFRAGENSFYAIRKMRKIRQTWFFFVVVLIIPSRGPLVGDGEVGGLGLLLCLCSILLSSHCWWHTARAYIWRY